MDNKEEEHDSHDGNQAIYDAENVDKKDYKIRADYEHKKLMYQVIFMVIASGLISLCFYLQLTPYTPKSAPVTPPPTL
jgi:hypothetical protein